MWRTSPTRREYLGGDSDSDGYRRPHQDWRPPDRRGYPGGRPPDRGGYPDRGGRPLTEEDTLADNPLIEVEGPLMEEDPLDLLEDKDHQVLKDPLDL